MKTEFTKQYFIDKVTALKENQFTTGQMSGDGCHCMLGHCGATEWKHTEESIALTKLMHPEYNAEVGGDVYLGNPVIDFNDKISRPDLKEAWLKKLNSL